MIKSLLDADENPPPGIKVTVEETIVAPPPPLKTAESEISAVQLIDTNNVSRAPHPENADTQSFTAVSENPVETSDFPSEAKTFSEPLKPLNEVSVPFQSAYYEPESQAETSRKSGLAYTAGIMLFFSVVFMMIIGWGADLLLGTAPWGIVGGIVLGALVGFVQFFRLTSQILKNKD